VIPLDPDLDQANRRFQAWKFHVEYTGDLSTWLGTNGLRNVSAMDVMAALGTGLDDFLRVADGAVL
jgi:hypothetical protein